MNQTIKDEYFEKISLGKTNEVLKELNLYIKKNKYRNSIKKEITILINRFNRISESKRLGIISTSEFEIEIGKINKSLIEVLEIIPENITQSDSVNLKEKITKRRVVLLAALLLMTFLIIVFYRNYTPQVQKDFKLSLSKNSKESYEYFLEHYPKSQHSKIAKQKLDSIEETRAVNALIAESETTIDEYLNEYPNGKFRKYMNSKKADLFIKPLLKIDIDDYVLTGDNFLVFDKGNKIISIELFGIKILNIKNAKVININYEKDKKGGLSGLTLSKDEKYFGFYNTKTKEVYVYSTSNGKLVSKATHQSVVFDINIANDCKHIIVCDEAGRIFYLNQKNSQLEQIQNGITSYSSYYLNNNNLVLFDSWDDNIKVCSFNGQNIIHNLSLYQNESWVKEEPIFSDDNTYMILASIDYGENACEYRYADNISVFNIDKGEFLYTISNEKFIHLNHDKKKENSFFSFTSKYIFKRDLSNGNIVDTVSSIKEAGIEFIFKEIDINNNIIAYSTNANWDKVQIWDYDKGKRLWGVGSSKERSYCTDDIYFANKDYFITETDDYLRIWKTMDILKRKNE